MYAAEIHFFLYLNCQQKFVNVGRNWMKWIHLSPSLIGNMHNHCHWLSHGALYKVQGCAAPLWYYSYFLSLPLLLFHTHSYPFHGGNFHSGTVEDTMMYEFRDGRFRVCACVCLCGCIYIKKWVCVKVCARLLTNWFSCQRCIYFPPALLSFLSLSPTYPSFFSLLRDKR